MEKEREIGYSAVLDDFSGKVACLGRLGSPTCGIEVTPGELVCVMRLKAIDPTHCYRDNPYSSLL